MHLRLTVSRYARGFRRLTEQRGDTVVEVLIAIAVISLVLGAAYVTSNRSLQGTRDAEERSSALKLAETQVEQIKYLAAASPNTLFGASVPASYCLISNVAIASSSPQCKVDSTGTATTIEPAYSMAVTRTGNTFTIRTTWTKVRSEQINSVELKYRAYQ